MFTVGGFPSLLYYNIYTSFITKIQEVFEILRSVVIL
jgi:hypothetical protein